MNIVSTIKRHISSLKHRFGRKGLMSHKKDLQFVRKLHGRKMPKLKQLRHAKRVLSRQERLIVRFAAIILGIGILWLAVSAVSAYRTAVPAVGGQYTEAIVGSPQLINPVFASVNDVDLDISRLIYSGLMRYDEHQELVPDLAESYEISDDKKIYTFNLKKDVRWHDGEPFTARDVVYTFETIQNPAVNSPLRVSFQGVDVEAVDDYTVVFTLQEPFSPFLSSLIVGILPEHIWFDIAPDRMRLAPNNLQPIGTGPFLFKKFTKDNTGNIFRFVMARYPGYYAKPPYIEEFTFQFYGQYDGPDGAIQALREKKVDGLHFVPYDLQDKVERKHITMHTMQLPQYTALFFNQEKENALDEDAVRSALALAVDRDRILREVIRDEGQVIDGPILPGYPGYNPDVEKTPYSIDQANELLDEDWDRVSLDDYKAMRKKQLLEERLATLPEVKAAFEARENDEENEDVTATSTQQLATIETEIAQQVDDEIHEAQTFFRKNDDDDILKLSLVTADTPEYRQAAQIVAGAWQEIGITVDLTFVDPRDISRNVLRDRSYDVLLYGAIIGSDPDQYPFWHSSQVKYPGLNLANYADSDVDTLLENARESSDPEKVAQYYTDFQKKILEDKPAIFLYTPTYTYATTDDVKGIAVTRIFAPADRFANVTDWYVKTKGKWSF